MTSPRENHQLTVGTPPCVTKSLMSTDAFSATPPAPRGQPYRGPATALLSQSTIESRPTMANLDCGPMQPLVLSSNYSEIGNRAQASSDSEASFSQELPRNNEDHSLNSNSASSSKSISESES